MKFDLTKLWCKETCRGNMKNFWSSSKPAFGQDDVTTLLIQALHGGTIIKCNANGKEYYVNNILGQLCNYTKEEFAGTVVYTDCKPVTRESMLLDDELKHRYTLMSNRFKFAYGFDPNECLQPTKIVDCRDTFKQKHTA